MIAVDWGTSNFRAYRIDAASRIIDRRSSAAGILHVQQGGFANELTTQVGDWIQSGERCILVSGMAGSRHGWKETQYLPCPVGIADLTDAVVEVSLQNAQVFLVPGVTGFDADGIPEVMRGEETQVMGVLDSAEDSGLICLPGTHSKWVQVTHGQITSFITFLTGDLFEALQTTTILSRMMTHALPMDDPAFLRGVTRSANSGGLLHHLFGVRTLSLMAMLNDENSLSFLSGLLIGHEVRSVLPQGAVVRLAGDRKLCYLYAEVISACGGSSIMEHDDAAARGLTAIARRLQWI